jgi:purine-nucleoside phosphorylase
MLDRIQQAADFIQHELGLTEVKNALILGSGLGEVADHLSERQQLSYEAIPHFPVSTVEGHAGQLLCGKLSGVPVLILQGRFHYYEGYDLQQATFPVRVLRQLGVQNLLLSNASGGLNPAQKIGDIMLLEDHIHLFSDNPLRGKNYEELGPRFPDMSQPYSFSLIEKAIKFAAEQKIKIHQGVYVGTSGPTYETRAEYKYFRYIGGDAVGMSTTPEVIVAVHAGMQVFALSVISDMGVEGQIVEITHEEVQEVAKQAAPKMQSIFSHILKSLHTATEKELLSEPHNK